LVPSKEVEQSVILGGEETFLLLIGLVRWEGWITLYPPPTHNIQTSKKLRPGGGGGGGGGGGTATGKD
jgi:hypothetical protein